MLSVTGRNVVKAIAQTAYATALVGLSTTAIEAVVDPQDESAEDTCQNVGIGIGLMVWWRTGGVVNYAIDKIADHRLARKAEQAEEADAVQ